MSQDKRRGLGRGLSALMADVEQSQKPAPSADASGVMTLPIDVVFPNPDQPRRMFEPEALQDLADSISAKGIIQPLVVRAHPTKEGAYEIVAGERRWRASQLAKLHEVPAVLRDFSDIEVLEVAIIENIQRADLNPVEEALSFKQLMESFNRTQEQMASALGKSRPYISNALRLLNLPEDVLSHLKEGRLTAGHARALVGHEKASDIALSAVTKGLSVREVEKLAKAAPSSTRRATPRAEKDADTRALEGDLSATLGMRVSIDHGPNADGGRLTITYKDLDQLDDLCRALAG